jgi:hypothetical protein
MPGPKDGADNTLTVREECDMTILGPHLDEEIRLSFDCCKALEELEHADLPVLHLPEEAYLLCG